MQQHYNVRDHWFEWIAFAGIAVNDCQKKDLFVFCFVCLDGSGTASMRVSCV